VNIEKFAGKPTSFFGMTKAQTGAGKGFINNDNGKPKCVEGNSNSNFDSF